MPIVNPIRIWILALIVVLIRPANLMVTEGALVRTARAGQLFRLLLIPTPVLGVDSTPRMGEWVGGWVGGWDGAIWDDFSSCTCPFPVGDMFRALSNWGYGLAPFRLGIWTGPFPSPIVP